MRTIRVAIAGLGFVGRETARLLKANQANFRARLGASIEICAVCDRDVRREARGLGLPGSVRLCREPRELLQAPGLDIVIELLGGLEAPRDLVLGALNSGRHVVTANKRLLSHSWRELQAASARGGGRLYFEASVAGGIPILQALDQGFAANRIQAVYGILNGTTNYILTRAESGLGIDEALAEAQSQGLAEKDPSLDLSGQDTAQKISVLASLLTGAAVSPSRIACEGITRIAGEDLAFARESLGRAARLLGVLRLDWSAGGVRLEAHVWPTLVPLDHPLAAVRREYNAVLIKASSAGDLMFYGKGAGPGPTASAVAGDIFRLAREILGGLPPQGSKALPVAPRGRPVTLRPIEDSVSPFYLRLLAQDRPGVLARVAAALGHRGISIASIHQPATPSPRGVPVMITTHPTTHGRLRRALREILGLSAVARRHAVLRLLQ